MRVESWIGSGALGVAKVCEKTVFRVRITRFSLAIISFCFRDT